MAESGEGYRVARTKQTAGARAGGCGCCVARWANYFFMASLAVPWFEKVLEIDPGQYGAVARQMIEQIRRMSR